MTAIRGPNVLLSSAGRRVVLLKTFRAALSQLAIDGQVLTADASPLSAAARVADAGFLVPPCTDAGFVPAVLELCREHDVGLVVPTIDPELPVLAAARARFAADGVVALVSSPEVVALSTDKVLTHEWLRACGFPTVRQAMLAEVQHHLELWPFPFLSKPRFGSASSGVVLIRDAADLEAARRRPDVLAQSVASGSEYTVDVLIDSSGSLGCAVPRRRLEVRGGEVSKGVTARVPEVLDLVGAIAEALPGATGPITIQVFWDADVHELAVIEINPRFGGGFPLSWEAGGLYPRWILEELHGLPSTMRSDLWREGVVMLRYDDAVFASAAEVGLR